jgi:hypothetical protein
MAGLVPAICFFVVMRRESAASSTLGAPIMVALVYWIARFCGR